MSISNFFGVRFVTSPFALQQHTEYRIERCAIKKRRRGYRVRKHQWTTPGCYQLADGSLVLHPDLVGKLQTAALRRADACTIAP